MNELLFQSSIDEIISKRAIPTEMLRDLHNIANLSEAACQSVAHAVDALEGLTTSETIETAIRDAIGGDGSPAASSINAALGTLSPDSVEPLVSSVTDWVNANDARKKIFSEESLQHLTRNLEILLTDHRVVRLLQRDAEGRRIIIPGSGGKNHADTFQAVMDHRPQRFNRFKRTQIEEGKHEPLFDDPLSEGWGSSRATKLVPFLHTAVPSDDAVKESDSFSSTVSNHCSAEELLTQLECSNTPKVNREDAILFAASTAFSDEQRPRLLEVLARYINENRFSDDEDIQVVVGSAARKYSMNMTEGEFETFAEWLSPSQTSYLSEIVELEFVKGICWRVTYARVVEGQTFPGLTETLFQIVAQYTNSRILLQKNFDTISLNATVALFILDAMNGTSDIAAAMWEYIDNANLRWFTELVVRRIEAAAKSIDAHTPALATALRSLMADVGTMRESV